MSNDENGHKDLFKELIAEVGLDTKKNQQQTRASEARRSPLANIQQRARDVEDRNATKLRGWADEIREAPNEALRCALFTPRNKNQKREIMKDHEIASYGSNKVFYTGEELRQDDLDVWLQILHLARGKQLGETIYFDHNEIKKALGWGWGKERSERLKTILKRLKATAVEFHSARLGAGVVISMIRKFDFSDLEDGKRKHADWSIELEPEIALLFGGGVYSTRIEWEQRLALKGPLAKWLHGFYSTHKAPHDLTSETILHAAGTKTADKFRGRQMIKDALGELKGVGFLTEFSMSDKGTFSVTRAPYKNSD
jgi:hypothetical protein